MNPTRDSIDDTLDWLSDSKQTMILKIINSKNHAEKEALTDDAARLDHCHSLIRRAYRPNWSRP